MLVTPHNRAAVAIGAITFVTAIFSALTLLTIHLARQAEEWVSHTQTVLTETRTLLKTMAEAETSEHGYLLSGDQTYLENLDTAEQEVPRLLVSLKSLTNDNAGQQVRLNQVRNLASAKLATIRAELEAQRQGRNIRQVDKAVMDSFRTAEKLFEDEEYRLLEYRKEALDDEYGHIVACSAVLSVLVLAAMIYAAVALRRSEARAWAAESLAQQAQRMETIGQLTGGVAHDFNNILQAVITNLDLAVGKLGPDHAARNFIQAASGALDKGAKLTGQLLAFARRQPLRPEPVAIDRLLADATAFLRRTLGEKYDIEVVGAAGLWRALVDPQLLQNAILNLALNARDAMPDGGKLTLEVTNVTLDADYAARESEVLPGQYVMVAASDTGSGMSPETLAKVFEPFFTTKADGTGLGLAMVYGFVKQSQGHVKIYSEQGHGTTVKMYLPRTNKEAELRAETHDQLLRGDGQTILVVEDDDSVRAGAVAQLSDLGYKVVAAADGQSALSILNKDPGIKLLFTDIVLVGDINGREVADRARRSRPELAVVYTSGYTENAIIHHGRLDKGAILLSKPYRTADLARVIGVALANLKPARSVAVPQAAAAPRGTADRRTILVVEDDDLVRAGLVLTLEDLNHQVIAAKTATEGLAALDRHGTVDLLVADLGLPDMSGLELVEAARARLPALDVVIASGTPRMVPENQDAADRSTRWLLKPFTPAQLKAAVEAGA